MIDAGILDHVTQQFTDSLAHDSQSIQKIALSVFYYLTLIQLVLASLWAAFTPQPIHSVLSKIAWVLLMYGLFYAGIEYGSQWIPQVINGFIEIGQQSGVASISPSHVLARGLNISSQIFSAFFNWGVLGHPFVAFIGGVVCISIVILYALLAAELVIVIVKSYVLVSFASLFFAFASSPLTRPMLVCYGKSVVGIGLQLMTSYFLMAVGQAIGQDWASVTAEASKNHQLIPMLMIFSTVIVYYMIVKNVPCFIAGLSGVAGFRNYGDEAISAVVGTSMDGSRQLSSAVQQGGRFVQGSGQLASGFHKMQQSAVKASAGDIRFHQKIMCGTGELVKSGLSATQKTVGDTVMRRDTDLTAGQKFNKHLAKRLQGER